VFFEQQTGSLLAIVGLGSPYNGGEKNTFYFEMLPVSLKLTPLFELWL
jgi:hypothetical protein